MTPFAPVSVTIADAAQREAPMAVVLETDFAWPDVAIERGVIEAAGHRLITGPAETRPPEAIEALVAAHDPAAILTCWAEVSAAAIRAPQTLRIVQRLGVSGSTTSRSRRRPRAAPGSPTFRTIVSRRSPITRSPSPWPGSAASSRATAP